MLDAFRAEIINTQDAVQKQEAMTKEQIKTDLRADRDQRALLKSHKPSIN